MINPVLTACTLICDNCNREFNLDKRHVFKTPDQAMIMAEQHGWNVNFQNGNAICPECMVMPLTRFGVKEIRQALSNISISYHPRVGQHDSKERLLNLLAKELRTDKHDCDLIWKVCMEHNLVWYDEYSGIFKINL